MASPDERQGDMTATTTCYFCHEIPDSSGVTSAEGMAAATADLALRPTESAESKGLAGVAGEQRVAPIAGVGGGTIQPDPNSVPDQETMDLEER
jgi:hypothetical protein